MAVLFIQPHTAIFAKIFSMQRKFFFLFHCLILLAFTGTQAQSGTASASTLKKPKLVVGIVIDQMRWDYLYRFSDVYGNNGFKRMIGEGFTCENTLIPYVPTYTAPGHTCIYTGSVPAIHGIMGNNWYDKTTNSVVYCTDDSTVTTVGSTSSAGKMSPDNLWTTTITDELRLSNNFKSKVIGISLKDRGAILPAGHAANAAYWYDGSVGKWITSSYYMKELPTWVTSFNNKDLPGKYMSSDWNTVMPIDKYNLSTADEVPYEGSISGEKTNTFPHKLSAITTGKYESFRTTPYGITYTFDFAKDAIQNEQLGAGAATDFLAVSISSTDYIGHTFGPNSIEIEDTYIRLDKDIADFLQYLDIKFGKGNYLAFLTADHGAAHVPGFLNEHKIPAGVVIDGDLIKECNDAIAAEFGVKNGVLSLQNYQLYLNVAAIEKGRKKVADVSAMLIRLLKQKPYIIDAVETANIAAATLPMPQKSMIINSYNPKRSGDIFFTFKPAYFDGYSTTGTTHGLWNPYDAHIPLLFFGWNVKPGKTNRETYMTDISATIAAMLQIQMPNGNIGKVITEAMQP